MHTYVNTSKKIFLLLAAVMLLASLVSSAGIKPVQAQMAMPPEDGLVCTMGMSPMPEFNLNTQTGYIQTPDANVIYMWGFSEGNNPFQHPGPVLCVNEGDMVTVILRNTLPVDVSIVFPGQENVLANGVPAQPQFDALGNLTSLTNVATANGGSITYSFMATHPGTFLYESGTNPGIQVRMGLFGALVVRPLAGEYYAYDDAALPAGQNSAFNQGIHDMGMNLVASGEVMVLQSEIDPYLNQAIERGQNFNLSNYHPRYWLINGRGFPDSLGPNFASWMPSQPYGALAHIQPNDEMYTDGNGDWVPNPSPVNPLYYMERFLNVSSQPLPFHPHGRNAIVIGRDGQPTRGAGNEDLAYETFALTAGPGQTYDALFHWHNREGYNSMDNPLPVADPSWQNLAYGMYYSGSPYLGEMGNMPPGMQMMNECGEYYIIAHNHALHQLTSWGVVMTGPGTFMRVDPPGGCPMMAMP